MMVRVSRTALLLAVLGSLTVSTKAQPAQTQTDSAGAPAAVDHTPPDGPYYPGLPKSKTRLQATLGDFTVRFYGTILMNLSMAGTAQVGQDVPLWPVSGSSLVTFPDGTTKRAGLVHDTIFTARQSILGLQVTSAKPLEGWTSSGLAEIDFFGSRPVDTTFQPQDRFLNQPRLRRAYLQLDKGTWKIVAGQDKMIIAPLDPISLSHVAIPLGASAGDLWAWLPQVRVENREKFGKTTALFQVGVLRPSFGDPALKDQAALTGNAIDSTFSGYGERSGQPFYQARLALSHPINGRNATVGASAHYGREQVGAERSLDSWAFAVDATLPLSSRFIFRGEGYVGSNLVPFDGGIIQGVGIIAPLINASGVILTPARFSKIGDGGGWVEAIVPLTLDNKNVFYAGAGTDDPRDRDLFPGTNRSKNSFLWASYFRKLGPDVTAAVEWSFWDFQTRSVSPAGVLGPRLTSGRGNVINIALAYQF